MERQSASIQDDTRIFRPNTGDMHASNFLNPNLSKLTPKKLSFIILAIGIIVSTVISYPLSQVFAGNWKLNQSIQIGFVESFRFFGTTIPIGQISVRYYALSILFGMLAGYAMAVFLSRWHYIAGTVIDRLFIGLVIFGIVGARTFYVVFNWDLFIADPLNALLVFRGGLAFFGMLIGALLYLWAYTARFRFNVFEFLDFLAPSVLIGQIIGRFGNLFNYESYGGPTSVFWKMYVPDTANIYPSLNEQYFHPTFLYEIIPNFILLVGLLYNYEKLTNKRSGLVFAVYAIGYGIIRFFTEFFRLDALILQLQFLGDLGTMIRVSQISALLLAITGIIIFWKRRKVIYLKRTMAEIIV